MRTGARVRICALVALAITSAFRASHPVSASPAAPVVAATPAPGSLAQRGVAAGKAEGPHDYFELLRTGPYCHTAWSLRPNPEATGRPPYGNCRNPHWRDQLNYTADPSGRGGQKGRSGTSNRNTFSAGGFKEVQPSGYFYPSGDKHPEAQDAAKFIIPAFVGSGRLKDALDPSQTMVQLADTTPSTAFFARSQHIRVDSEIMQITKVDYRTGLLTVRRADKGTRAAAHAADTKIYSSYNTLDKNELLTLPLGTAFEGAPGTVDGHTYVFVWDDYLTAEWKGHAINGYKAYNFIRGTRRSASPWLGIQVFGPGGATTTPSTTPRRSCGTRPRARSWPA
jgi:hypothetical protein